MPRKFINGSGNDSSAAVREYLDDSTHRSLLAADLFVINTAPNYVGFPMGKQFLLTNYASPLTWSYKGNFVVGDISRGEIESKIGLEAATVDVSWTPQDTDILASVTDNHGTRSLTVMQGLERGVFDNATVEIWRALMPTLGDCDSLGACMMFAGRLGNIKLNRLKTSFTVTSRLETLNVQVPTNLIEPTNIMAQYSVGRSVPDTPSYYIVQDGSSRTVIHAAGGLLDRAIPDHTYDNGYLVMTTVDGRGVNGGTYRGIREQVTVSGADIIFYLYDPLPILPVGQAYAQHGDQFVAFAPVELDRSAGKPYAGFPYVPSPVNSATIMS